MYPCWTRPTKQFKSISIYDKSSRRAKTNRLYENHPSDKLDWPSSIINIAVFHSTQCLFFVMQVSRMVHALKSVKERHFVLSLQQLKCWFYSLHPHTYNQSECNYTIVEQTYYIHPSELRFAQFMEDSQIIIVVLCNGHAHLLTNRYTPLFYRFSMNWTDRRSRSKRSWWHAGYSTGAQTPRGLQGFVKPAPVRS